MFNRFIAMGDALSQFLQVTCCPHRDRPPNANESLSGRSHLEGWWIERVINLLFFWQRNPGHCERADRKDYERAKRKVAAYEQAKK